MSLKVKGQLRPTHCASLPPPKNPASACASNTKPVAAAPPGVPPPPSPMEPSPPHSLPARPLQSTHHQPFPGALHTSAATAPPRGDHLVLEMASPSP